MQTHHMDTDRKWHAIGADTALAKKMASIEVVHLADGRIEIHAEQSTLKTLGKGRWHTESVLLTLTPEQAAALKAAL